MVTAVSNYYVLRVIVMIGRHRKLVFRNPVRRCKTCPRVSPHYFTHWALGQPVDTLWMNVDNCYSHTCVSPQRSSGWAHADLDKTHLTRRIVPGAPAENVATRRGYRVDDMPKDQ